MPSESASYVRPSHIDLSQIEALNQNRTLAFINHWVLHTTTFLNQFSSICESRLRSINTKIRRAGDALALLEDKLSSIPGLEVNENEIIQTTSSVSQPTVATDVTPSSSTTPPPPTSSTVDAPTPNTEPESDKTTVNTPDAVDSGEMTEPLPQVVQNPIKSDPRYAKYFKMVAVGVPEPAVRVKMSAEGLDPKLLDNPEAPAPPTQTSTNSESENSDSSWDDD